MNGERIRCLSQSEEDRFLETVGQRKDAERAHMLYRLMLVTGMRIGEALRLNVGDAGQLKTEVMVKGWTKEGEKRVRVKMVYFPKVIREQLARFLRIKEKTGEGVRPDAPLFVSREGTRLSARQAQREFKKWMHEAGIVGRLTPHALRHTAATKLLRRTGNAKLVQRYLGHSDVATTLRFYVDVFPEDLERAAEMLSGRESVGVGSFPSLMA
jgi:site-specific recombinase XerD